MITYKVHICKGFKLRAVSDSHYILFMNLI